MRVSSTWVRIERLVAASVRRCWVLIVVCCLLVLYDRSRKNPVTITVHK